MKNETLILLIDTSSNKVVRVGLEIDGKKYLTELPLDRQKAQAVLPLVEQLLKNHKLSLKDLTGIKVNAGPGSYTGLRVGVSIANALGYLLNIPVNGKKSIIEPIYS